MAREPKDHDLASPVDLPGEAMTGGYPFAWTCVTIAVAALLLLCANAGALSGWIDEQDPTPLQQQLSGLANRWTAVMDDIGITAPRRLMNGVWKDAQRARFGDEAPGAGPQ